MSSSENNKRIAKNTLLLYFRMMLTMLVSLFTVRVVLNTLGVVDYGVYNVVGGIVTMFSFLSATMAAASQRFFAFELGKNDFIQLKHTFSLTVSIYIVIAIVVLILAETIGLWFLNTKMVIPSDRMAAANWIYQFSIFSFLVTIMTIPYNAAIIARENMKIYAYVSIVEVILKLLIVYLLVFFTYDKLKLYSILMFVTTCLVSSTYMGICRRKYEECRFQLYWERNLFKTLLSYSGWNSFGAIAGVINNQGINILLNLYFGPIVNAARGIAYQLNTGVNQFVLNFTTAVNPQITKYYAIGEKKLMLSLVFNSSKYSYFLLYILSMPVLLETNYLLELWLHNVPLYVVLFTRLIIINALIDALTYSMQAAAQATGKIKRYQTVVGGMMLFNLPISYILLKVGFPPQSTIYVSITISIICLFLRLWLLRNMIGLPIREYMKKVFWLILLVSFLAYLIPLFLIFQMEEGFWRFIIITLMAGFTSILTIYFVGLNDSEQHYFQKAVRNIIAIKLKSK